jgi:hypothetical protein
MTFFVYLISISLIIATALLFAVQHRRREASLAEGWKPVDFRAMARLFSAEDDRFLAANVSRVDRLKLRIQRAIAAGDYLSPLRANSRYAIAAASRNPQHSATVLEAATALRLEVLKLQLKIWLGVVAPLNVDIRRIEALIHVCAGVKGVAAMVPIR